MLTVIAFLVVLGVLVFVHEFGHFIVAKMCGAVSYTHLRAHETVLDLVCRLLLEKKNKHKSSTHIY